ncbi:exopolysaccharide biosynthesis protein [Tateyamaria armeniaca]|uniref:Exopolysaccharide biosynthesis protein n=1 Tax=Tateyamaria armeniaca TaxID=2518930 RepID=A0ABW8V0D2_9RHOB
MSTTGTPRDDLIREANISGDFNIMAPLMQDMAISDRLSQLVEDADGKVVTLGWILEQLHERAFGLFLLILALPCCIPFLYGLPQIVALPLMFVSGQILLGRRVPWLPGKLSARTVSGEGLDSLSRRSGPWLKRIEAVSRPRLSALTQPPTDRIVGLALVLFSASILVPLPGTNTVPGFAVVIVAMGLLQRDGLLVILGAALGTAWIGTLILAGATLASLIKTWIGL